VSSKFNHRAKLFFSEQGTAMTTALVTGASSGIGEALAREFAAGGHDLVLVARSEDKLLALAHELEKGCGIEVSVIAADLAKRRAARHLADELSESGVAVDILINCAGVLEHGPFTELSPASHQKLIDLNIGGLTALLAEFLPPMVSRGGGRVMNVASVAAFLSFPGLATYAATKAYVLSLTESLSEELKGTGVTVTALCPGVTDTNMVSTAQARSEVSLPKFAVGEVSQVAKAGYRACMKGDVICVPGALNQAATLTTRAVPKWLLRRVLGVVGRATLD
jgi:short-subunit dehydrogenase